MHYMDDQCMPKKILNVEIYGRKKQGQPRKHWVIVRGPQEDEHPELASEDPRSAGLEEDSEGGQGPCALDVVVVVVVMNL